MEQHYRNSLLAIFFCVITVAAFATGHTVSVTHINVSCLNACNGSANATVSGGTGPFTFAWMPGNMTTANINNLCAGTYTVVATDQADGSTALTTVVITQPTAITLSANVTPAYCFGGFGSATVTLTGGTAPYTFNWSPTGGTSPTLSNAPAGTYVCTVTDSNGCTATITVTITNPPPLSIAPITATPATICQGQTSQLNATVTGGTGGYTYNWSSPGSLNSPMIPAPVASPTVTTTYTMSVTDMNGCVATSSVTVFVNNAVTASISSTDPTCNQSNGSLTINVTQAAAPYTLLWSNTQTTATISNLSAGLYDCTVTDANGCTGNYTSGLSNIGGPTVTTSTTNTGCTNSSNGSAIANVTGVSPFTYLWNTSPAQTTQTATGLGMGSYMVTVTDAVGCVSVVPAQVNATSGNLFMYAYWSAAAVCAQATGSINTFVQGGTAPYSYAWSPGNSTAANLTNAAGGTYSVTVTDANGCSSSGSATIPTNCNNYIQGRVYIDVNHDSIYNAGDYPLQGYVVTCAPFSYYSVTDANGMYARTVSAVGTYDLSVPNANYYQNAVPQTGHNYVTFTMLGDSATNIDFVLTSPTPFQDLYCSLASGVARPGFVQTYSIHCENRGMTAVSDTIWFRHDSILSVISAYPPFDGYNYPNGYWLFNNFAPCNAINKTVYMQVPTIANGGYIGRNLIGNARIEPMASDTSSWDNGDDEFDVIVGSYDPNLKESWSTTMNSSGDIWPTDLTLDYTIHFQNSGTDTAFTVVVVDTLPVELDITTFRMGASSHPCTYSINGYNDTNIVTFTFMNILLPDSNRNEPASHGFVQFTIDRYPNLPIGTTIVNEANNYFDFNEAVVTNQNIVTVSNPLVVSEPEENNFSVYPNPAQENVNVLLGNNYAGKEAVVILRDISGREIARVNSMGSTMVSFDLAGYSAGVYFVTVQSADSNATQKMIISEK